ncbi:MAG: hypothetical protein QXH07_03075 [Thermoplasmata archaeon]
MASAELGFGQMTEEEVAKKFLIIGMISKTGFAHVPTFYSICLAALSMGKLPIFFISNKGSTSDGDNAYNIARNDVLAQIRNSFPKAKMVKIFWLDDDNILFDSNEVIEMCKVADANDWNISAPYHLLHAKGPIGQDLEGSIFYNVWRRATPEEMEKNGSKRWITYTYAQLEQLAKEQNTDYPVVDGAGLGSCYIKMPVDYVFHFDSVQGEDFWLWDDVYKDKMQLRVAWKMKTGHWKSLPI